MKMLKQDVIYIPAFYDEEYGCFQLEGGHCHSKKEGRKELRMLYERGRTQFFLAKVTVTRSKLPPAKPSKRKVA